MRMTYYHDEKEDGLVLNNNNNNNNYNYYKMMMNMEKKHQEFEPTKILKWVLRSTINKASEMLLLSNKNHKAGVALDQLFWSNYGILFESKEKWKLKDHLKLMSLMFTWFTMWASRLVTDFFPSCLFRPLSPHHHHQLTMMINHHHHHHQTQTQQGLSSSSTVGSSSSSPSSSSFDDDCLVVARGQSSINNDNDDEDLMISHDGLIMEEYGHHPHAGHSVEALGRALSHILGVVKELPVRSRKYEFAIAMADKLLDENTVDGNIELLGVNCVALSFAFEATVNRLSQALEKAANDLSSQQADSYQGGGGGGLWWMRRVIRKLPMGTYIAAYMKGGFRAVFPALQLQPSMWQLHKRRCHLAIDNVVDDDDELLFGDDQSEQVVGAEKLAQELLWMIYKLRDCHGVQHALMHWSLASNLSSLALHANPRVQALLLNISASLLRDIKRAEFKVDTQVQYRLLVLWLPVLCYASNGLRYPVLSSNEKIEVERTVEGMIARLAVTEQEIVLRNWLQDFAISSSDWPNLRPSYHRWCQSSRRQLL